MPGEGSDEQGIDPCSDICEECSLSATDPSPCLPTKRGTDPRSECWAGAACFSRGECRLLVNGTCSEGAECVSGACYDGLCVYDDRSTACADGVGQCDCSLAFVPSAVCTCPSVPPFGKTCVGPSSPTPPSDKGSGVVVFVVVLVGLVVLLVPAAILFKRWKQRRFEMNAFQRFHTLDVSVESGKGVGGERFTAGSSDYIKLAGSASSKNVPIKMGATPGLGGGHLSIN